MAKIKQSRIGLTETILNPHHFHHKLDQLTKKLKLAKLSTSTHFLRRYEIAVALDLTERQVTQFSLFNIWQKFSPFYIWWNFHSAIFGEENFRSIFDDIFSSSIFGENKAKPCIISICHLHSRSKCGFKTEGWNGKERKEGGDSKTFENGKRKQQDFSHFGNGQWEKTFSYQLFFPQENLERWQVIRDFYSSPAVPYSVQKVDWVNKTSTYLFCRILQNKKGWTHFLL